jgi:hypothetical protein
MFRTLLDLCPNPALHEPYATKAFIGDISGFLICSYMYSLRFKA